MNPWDLWKKGFDAWENATASYLEQWTRSPLLLAPSGVLLAAAGRAKAATDAAVARAWGLAGVATRRDQERTLHALNQIQSRLMDLEERLQEET